MKNDGTVPFPGANGGAPKLPEMTAAERRLWLASHRAPENMLLVATAEMVEMRAAFDACVREVKDWRRIGRMYMGADLPEGFEPALRLYMKQREQLEERVKKLETTSPAVIDPKVKAVPGTAIEP